MNAILKDPAVIAEGVDLDFQIEQASARIGEQETLISEIRSELRDTEWIFNRVDRPRGANEDRTRQHRSDLIKREAAENARLREMRAELQPLLRERDELARGNGPTMSDLESQMTIVKSKLEPLSSALSEKQAVLQTIDAQVAAVDAAREALREAQAAAFLVGQKGDIAQTQDAEQRVADLDLALDVAKAKAVGGTAARGSVESEVSRLQGEIRGLDSQLDQLTASRDHLRKVAATAAALRAVDAAVAQCGEALAQLREADGGLAGMLRRAWSDGLFTLKHEQPHRTARPAFLRHGV